MRCSLVVLLVALAVSGCLGSDSQDEPARSACDREIPTRVEVPAGTGSVPIGGYANLVAAGAGRVWTLVTREQGGPRVLVGIDPRTGDVTRPAQAGGGRSRARAAGSRSWTWRPGRSCAASSSPTSRSSRTSRSRAAACGSPPRATAPSWR